MPELSGLAVMINRFGPDGLYLLDEPEAALCTITCLRRIHELVSDGSQFAIATHSPIGPKAQIVASGWSSVTRTPSPWT